MATVSITTTSKKNQLDIYYILLFYFLASLNITQLMNIKAVCLFCDQKYLLQKMRYF